jgi:predicted lipoprotein with Yx(FWY)xxD motif
MSKRISVFSGAAALALIAACSSGGSGGGGAYGGGGGGSSAPASAGAQAAAVTISTSGTMLTGTGGRTLYANTVDTATTISCTGECALAWPAVTGKATAGSGVDDSKLGTIARPDGVTQVTYNGHPLYEFKNDKAAGDKNGEGIADGGGTWHAATVSLTPMGSPSTPDDHASSSTANNY